MITVGGVWAVLITVEVAVPQTIESPAPAFELVELPKSATATGARTAPAAKAAIPGCAPGSLNLVEDGVLTVGTDNPAFPPWFGGAEKTKPRKV